MNDRTWPPAGDRLLGNEPEDGFGRVLPGPWPAGPARAPHPGTDGTVVEADFVARGNEHWAGAPDFDAFDVFDDSARRVPPPNPRSPFTGQPPFFEHARQQQKRPATTSATTDATPGTTPSAPVTPIVPAQSKQGTPPGGWPAVGSPANRPARPQPWPSTPVSTANGTGSSTSATRSPDTQPNLFQIRPAQPAFPDPGFPIPPAPAARTEHADARRIRWHLIGYPVAIAASVVVGMAITGTPFGHGPTPVAAVPSSGTTGATGATGATAKTGAHPFGETVRFADGSTLTTGAPTPFTPSGVAFGGEDFAKHVKVKVTFVNNSDKVVDPSLSVGSITAGDREGKPVYQPAFDPPDNAVLPGKRVTWWMGFGVADPRHVSLTVRMGFQDYDDVIFTNER